MAVKIKGNKTLANVSLIGLDVGFGETKMKSSAKPEKVLVFPSFVISTKKSSSKMFSMDEINSDNLVVTTEEGTFVVGERATNWPSDVSKRTKERDRANDISSRVLFQTTIALGVPDTEGEHHVHIVTGLPNTDYDIQIQQRLESFLQQEFEVEFHLSEEVSIKKKIIVDAVTVLRQPEGSITYHQFAFNKSGEMVAVGNPVKYVGVIDIGHFTTDFGIFEDSVIIEDDQTNGSTVAVNDIYKQFKVKLRTYFDELGLNYEPSDKDLDQIIRDKEVFYAGKDHDVSEIYNESVKMTAAKIVKNVIEAWGSEANRLRLILLTGGGAFSLQEAIKEELTARHIQSFSVVSEPVVANAIGYYMYGCMELQAEEKYTEDVILEEYISALSLVD